MRKWLFLILSLYMSIVVAEDEGSLRLPHELENATLEDKAGVSVPFDVELIDHDGRRIILGDYFNPSDKRPIIMTIGYYGCPMLCSLVLNGLLEGLKDLNFKAGADYRLISVSIDEREQPSLAKAKQIAYAQALGISPDQGAWNFHVMSSLDAKKLSNAVGFNYYFDKKNDQFAHGAGFFVLTPAGILARTLFGINFSSHDIKLALSEAAEGKIGSFLEQILLSCFHYNPDSQRYGVYIMGVMRLGGLLTMLIVGGVLLMYFRQERKRSVV